MANIIANRLVVSANSNEELNDFLRDIKGDVLIDGEHLSIDFNKIIPMPDEIKTTESSSVVDNCIFYYLTMTDQGDAVGHILKSVCHSFEMFEGLKQEKLDEMFSIGKKYVDIFKKHGAKDWYDWSVTNWGTKWNAYHTDIVYLDTCEAVITFNTAWSGVPYIINELSERYPSLTFDYTYADEDMGNNCGRGRGEDGEFLYTLLMDGSDEAIDTYALCWDFDEEVFYKDDNGTWHNREFDDSDE
jgi:hypothetical protein